MHTPNPQSPGLLQLAEKAQQLASHSKQERMAVVFQAVSVVSVAVMGLAASAHLIRELLGHGHAPRTRDDHRADDGHAARLHERRCRSHGRDR